MSTVLHIQKNIQKKFLKPLKKREKEMVFAVSLVLVAALSFFGGVAYQEQGETGVMVIEKPVLQIAEGVSEGRVAGIEDSQLKTQSAQPEMTKTASTAHCLFVGSKNSDKYHSPSCGYAKNIKPENIVCFASREEAEKQGYQEGCIK